MPVPEATVEETPYGRRPTSEGWFVVNFDEAFGVRGERGSAVYLLESRTAPFRDFGLNVRLLWPGQPNALYHSEGLQEGFLVLSGECTLIVEEEERQLRQWDYFHCPAETAHVFVGAGEGPCAILMIGARTDAEKLWYPASELAATYGASSAKDTPDPEEAYADWPSGHRPERIPWPPEADA